MIWVKAAAIAVGVVIAVLLFLVLVVSRPDIMAPIGIALLVLGVLAMLAGFVVAIKESLE